MSDWSRELHVAIQAARIAGDLAVRQQEDIEAETKDDQSPVTKADRDCERLIVSSILEAFPDDGLLGEEGASKSSTNGRQWIIDPIDGTRDYVRGNPLWANLIALEVDGDVVLGVVHLPALGLLYSAQKGNGAYCNGKRIHASAKSAAGESVLCFSGMNKVRNLPFSGRLLDWIGEFWAFRGLGGAPDAMMVASGQAEIFIEPSAKPWDFAALKPIAEEAGARYLNLDGGYSIYAGNCIICSPGWEPEIRRMLGVKQ